MPKKSAPRKPETTETKVKDEALEQVAKDFTLSWDYCAGSLHDRWSRNYKLYHNERVKRGYDGITDTFVPMTFGTIETLVSALFGSKPKFNFLPPHDQQDQNTDILNALIDYYWERDQWSVKDIDTGREMLQLGTSIDYFYWHNDHPVKIHIPLRDFFIDPTATSLDNARYMGRRYLTTIDELKSFEIIDWENPIMQPQLDETGQPMLDPEMGTPMMEESYQMKKKYKNLDDIEKPETATSEDNGKGASVKGQQQTTDKQEKDNFYGSTLPDGADGQVEVLEYWTKDRVISVANRNVVIEDTKNYYLAKAEANGVEFPEGLMPFAAARDYVDASLFYAKGEIDFIADQQELLNDITNQNIDSVTYTLNQMYTLDPNYKDMIEEVENLPGAVYPFPKDALVPIAQRPIPPDAFNERMNVKNEMREATAVNEIVKGVGDQQGGGSTTATEINAQVAGAGQRMALKITQLENEYYHRVAQIIFCMVKLYVTEPTMVRIVGKDGANWEEFDPKDFQGNYEPRAQLDIAIQNKKQEEAAKAKEMLAAFLNDPEVNQTELKKLVLSKGFQLEPDEVEQLMQVDPMQQMMQMGMAGGMPGAGMPPGAPQAPPHPDETLQPSFDPNHPDMGAAGAQMAPGVPQDMPIEDILNGLGAYGQ